MVLINELTVEQINAALLHLQRSKDEIVGGNKGTTIQNISVNNSGGGGNNVDYSGTIKLLARNIETNKDAIDKNTSDIASLKDDMKNIEKSVEETLQGLVDNGISDISFDTITKQLTITTNDGDTFQTVIAQDIGVLSYDSVNNKLVLTTGEQTQAITLPYILSSEKGSANGVATLDENGRVPYSQLPESTMEFLGQWDASTNTPHLADGTGTNGDFYIVSVGGTVNLGTAQDPHNVTFYVNDRIVYEGDIAQWVRLPAGQVSSVNGQSGAVVLTASDIEYSTGVSIKAKIDANAVQADWSVSDTSSLAYIKNKPTIPVSPVQSDWNVSDTTSLAYIKNKPSLATVATSGKYCDLIDIPTSVPFAEIGGYLGERAAVGCAPNRTYGVANVWNYCGDSRYYLVGTKYDNPSCRYNVRVDYATSSTKVYHDVYTSDCDRPIMVTSDDQTSSVGTYAAQGTVRSGCNFTYNPATGQLKLKSSGKTACISHINTSYLHIYTDAPGIAFNQDIYLPDGKYICRAKYACCASCNGSGVLFGSAAVCDATKFVPKRTNGYLYNPAIANYWGSTGGKYFRIKIPKGNATWGMVALEVSLRTYGGASSNYYGKILIHGYWSSSADWNQFTYSVSGSLPSSGVKVYGSDKQYIYVYTNTTYTTASLDRVLLGDSITNYDVSDMEIDNVSVLPATYQTATLVSQIADSGNGNATTFAYSKAGLTSNPSWLAAWNGYELRAVSPSVVCVSCAGATSCADKATLLSYSGTACCAVSAYSDNASYCGSDAGWANYLIFNHGNGDNYYNQMIRMPFTGIPQYQRKVNGTNSGWKTFITSENISTQHVACADNASCANALSWTYCGCCVYVNDNFVRTTFYQDMDCDIYNILECFVKVVTRKTSLIYDSVSVIGGYCGTSDDVYRAVASVHKSGNCMTLYQHNFGALTPVNFAYNSGNVRELTDFNLIAYRL